MKNIVLLTGGAGFIGSHLAEKYSDLGYEVVIIDNLSSGKLENLKNILDRENVHFNKIDIRDKEALEEIFNKYKPNIVNHHAAQKSIPKSVENPKYDMEINGLGLLNIIEMIRKYSVKKLIFASTGGALAKLLIGDEKSKESDMPQLASPYAITKFLGENYIKVYSELYNFEYTILRYANVFGPRQVPEGECGAIPIFVNNVIDDKPSILMTYDDMPRGCTRDYIYIDDIVEANMLGTVSCINDFVNIGSGKEIPMLDIYELINIVYGKNLPVSIAGPREGDMKRSVLDISKSYNKLNWKPKVDLKEGLVKLYNYNKK